MLLATVEYETIENDEIPFRKSRSISNETVMEAINHSPEEHFELAFRKIKRSLGTANSL